MTFVERCPAVDVSGARCSLPAGHPGGHQLPAPVAEAGAPEPVPWSNGAQAASPAPARQPASLARVIITPAILMAAGFLIAGIYGLAIGAVIGIVYVLWAIRR